MSKLTEEQIIELAVAKGIEAANKRFEALQKKHLAERKDKRLYNTKLLIRNYRMFKAHAQSSIYSAADCEDSVFDILALMSDSKFSKAETTVKSIQSSAARTAIMVNHIAAMIETYGIWCKNSGKPENERRFRVITAAYINDSPMSPEEIAAKENIDKRTVYKDIDSAIEILASLIFGINSIPSGH